MQQLNQITYIDLYYSAYTLWLNSASLSARAFPRPGDQNPGCGSRLGTTPENRIYVHLYQRRVTMGTEESFKSNGALLLPKHSYWFDFWLFVIFDIAFFFFMYFVVP